ncbi:MAG TPA: M20/M25/M40 family metallo-hydrolase [Candidatus Limnocylindrales bacterium]|nr:M20/M25/M40 family metallo-hydrolase [Candidatus Limnocylindrales bacterium]
MGRTSPAVPRPSDELSAETWADAHDHLVGFLRDVIRIPSINPPNPPGPELDAANRIAEELRSFGLEPEVLEPFPGRGSVVCRLRGDGTGGDPLLILSHLDVVPAASDGWTHGPFDADVADGYVWGRGAVDMKAMVALSVGVMRLLAARATEAGLDPATDPIPGLRRDVLFACTADEENGGWEGAGWIVDNRPELLRAAAAFSEAGGVSADAAGRRFYPILVAEKGHEVYRIHVRGTQGHGSLPRDDNAAVLAAEVVRRLATPGEPRITPVVRRLLDEVGVALGDEQRRLLDAATGDDQRRAELAISALCDPIHARILRAVVRDTFSPDVIHAGSKYNIIPGDATVEVDIRTLPGTTPDDIREEILARLGELAQTCELEQLHSAISFETPVDEVYELLADTILAADPDGVPVPMLAPFATDGKHLVRLGVRVYGFSPLRQAPGEGFLDNFHSIDERVGIEALRWGLPVLYDATVRFCG